jgi:enterochelin esterase-like enzyme
MSGDSPQKLWFLLLALAACTSPTPAYDPPAPVPLQTATPTVTPLPPTPTSSPTPTPICAGEGGRVETGTYVSQILGREMPYRIYLPPCYGVEDSVYPTLYLLHGYPFNESHWDRLGVDEAVDEGIRAGIYSPFLVVMPNCDPSPEGIFVNTSGGDFSVEGLVVNELIPHVDQTYRTWAEREGRAIGGISRGGVWSLEIGFRRSNLFAAVGAHSAALVVNYPLPAYDPFNLAADPAVGTLRIWLDAGDVDWARGGVEELHRTLEGLGVVHEYVVGEGPHEDEYWSRMLPIYMAFYTAGWAEGGE